MIDKNLQQNEFAPYYADYIFKAPKNDILKSLKKSYKIVSKQFKQLNEEQWMYRYSQEKWTPKEMLLHIIDTERVMLYRALRVSRNDMTKLKGYEQDDYILPSEGNSRSSKSLLKEYKLLRKDSLYFFKNLSQEQLSRIGNASASSFSVKALAYVISGHEIHHLNVLLSKYL